MFTPEIGTNLKNDMYKVSASTVGRHRRYCAFVNTAMTAFIRKEGRSFACGAQYICTRMITAAVVPETIPP